MAKSQKYRDHEHASVSACFGGYSHTPRIGTRILKMNEEMVSGVG
jgi:hypothetical protein